MGRQGFEPWKAEPTDLQSAPFDRSGISPYQRANLGIRTLDPEITNHVLWPAELSWHKYGTYHIGFFIICQVYGNGFVTILSIIRGIAIKIL